MTSRILLALVWIAGPLPTSPVLTAPCAATYATATTLDDALESAGRDIRACAAAGHIAASTARRGLVALADLRDRYAYDDRRAWGTRSRRRERVYGRRLQAIMVRTLPQPAIMRGTGPVGEAQPQ